MSTFFFSSSILAISFDHPSFLDFTVLETPVKTANSDIDYIQNKEKWFDPVILATKRLLQSSADLRAAPLRTLGGFLLPAFQPLQKVTCPDILVCRQLSLAKKSRNLTQAL
jgi:hypothetical protein